MCPNGWDDLGHQARLWHERLLDDAGRHASGVLTASKTFTFTAELSN